MNYTVAIRTFTWSLHKREFTNSWRIFKMMLGLHKTNLDMRGVK